MLLTLCPSLELKFSNTRWGYCSDTVEDEKVGVS
jgi:hypothetical protein